MTTGYVWLERYGWHDTGRYAGFRVPGASVQPAEHFESADSKVRLASIIEVSGLAAHLVRLPVTAVTEVDLLRVHTPHYLARIQEESAQPKGGDAGDGMSPFGQGSYEIAKLAAGGTASALAAVLNGTVTNAYALVRPPGHHARRNTGMGFCIFSNIGVALASARAELGLGRVAVLDWDVHHGNGTQEIFYEDPETLVISIHQDQLFPADSGHLEERGAGAGKGYTINVPLPAGSGNGAYTEVLRRVAVPALQAFRPEIIVVASGFDASMNDPMGRMLVTAEGYREMTDILRAAAGEICAGKLVFSHEGGYSPTYVPYCGLAVLESLCGVRTGMTDPQTGIWEALPDQRLKPHQDAVIKAASEFLPDLGAVRAAP
jgi:acetoin utilization deacetylase AcuC-like enzyme